MRLSVLLRTVAPALGALALASGAAAQQVPDLPPYPPKLPPWPEQPAPDAKHIVYPVTDDVFMITGPGGNVTVQVGAEGVLVVDTGAGEATDDLLSVIKTLSDKPIRFIVNTSADPDHVGGNLAVSASGNLLEGGNTRPAGILDTPGAPIWAHEGTLSRLALGDGDPMSWPSNTYFVDMKDVFFNGEPVQLIHMPAAHTDGDTAVFFRRNDVIAAGDIYTPDRYPEIDLEHGGSIQGYLNALNHLIRLTVTEYNQEGGTYVVPGHGRLSDEADVADYRDMVTYVRDRIQAMIDKGLTLAQVKAARPTLDFDPNYGAEAGAEFTEKVYQSLSNPPADLGS